MFIGMLAADERVKNACTPLTLRQVSNNGYGLRLSSTKAMSGLNMNVLASIHPTSSNTSLPYVVNTSRPLCDTDVNTKPIIPNGANWMIHFTVLVITSEKLCIMSIVCSLAFIFNAKPNRMDQNRIPI